MLHELTIEAILNWSNLNLKCCMIYCAFFGLLFRLLTVEYFDLTNYVDQLKTPDRHLHHQK